MVLVNAMDTMEILLFETLLVTVLTANCMEKLTRQISFLLQMSALQACPERVQGQ